MNKDKVMALVKKKSKETGAPVNMLLLLYFFEHFLDGLAESTYRTDLILKGGFLVSSVLGIATRTTTDMDMSLMNQPMNEETLNIVFEEISRVSSKEGVKYEIREIEPIKIADQYPGYKVHIMGKLQNIKQPFSIDVATGDPITPKAIEYCYRSVFDESKEIGVLSYNLETIVAEKIETLVSRKTDNSRSKDFYDLYIILTLKEREIDKYVLLKALSNTFEYRLTQFDLDEILSDLENIRKDTGFIRRWELYCAKNAYAGEIDFDHIISTIEEKIKDLRGND